MSTAVKLVAATPENTSFLSRTSSKFKRDIGRNPGFFTSVVLSINTRPGSSIGNGFQKKASITEKIAALAPIPRASEATAKSVTADALVRVRRAYRTSSRIVVIASPRSNALRYYSWQPQCLRGIDTRRLQCGEERCRRAHQQETHEHFSEHSSVRIHEPED